MFKRFAKATHAVASSSEIGHDSVSKTASITDGFGNVKLRPGYLYVRTRAISARVNQNYDGFRSEELKKAHKSFIGRPVFVNHNNHDPSRARGVIVGSIYKENGNDKYIDILTEVDPHAFPKLAQEIRSGNLDSVSMGCDVVRTKCSYCYNVAETPDQFCPHVNYQKGQVLDRVSSTGQKESVLVYEDCEGLNFFEISYVFDPADETAYLSDVYELAQTKTAFGEPTAPATVDTLRSTKLCPQCGDESFDGKCQSCGYTEPLPGLGEPNLQKAKELRQERQSSRKERGTTMSLQQALAARRRADARKRLAESSDTTTEISGVTVPPAVSSPVSTDQVRNEEDSKDVEKEEAPVTKNINTEKSVSVESRRKRSNEVGRSVSDDLSSVQNSKRLSNGDNILLQDGSYWNGTKGRQATPEEVQEFQSKSSRRRRARRKTATTYACGKCGGPISSQDPRCRTCGANYSSSVTYLDPYQPIGDRPDDDTDDWFNNELGLFQDQYEGKTARRRKVALVEGDQPCESCGSTTGFDEPTDSLCHKCNEEYEGTYTARRKTAEVYDDYTTEELLQTYEVLAQGRGSGDSGPEMRDVCRALLSRGVNPESGKTARRRVSKLLGDEVTPSYGVGKGWEKRAGDGAVFFSRYSKDSDVTVFVHLSDSNVWEVQTVSGMRDWAENASTVQTGLSSATEAVQWANNQYFSEGSKVSRRVSRQRLLTASALSDLSDDELLKRLKAVSQQIEQNSSPESVDTHNGLFDQLLSEAQSRGLDTSKAESFAGRLSSRKRGYYLPEDEDFENIGLSTICPGCGSYNVELQDSGAVVCMNCGKSWDSAESSAGRLSSRKRGYYQKKASPEDFHFDNSRLKDDVVCPACGSYNVELQPSGAVDCKDCGESWDSEYEQLEKLSDGKTSRRKLSSGASCTNPSCPEYMRTTDDSVNPGDACTECGKPVAPMYGGYPGDGRWEGDRNVTSRRRKTARVETLKVTFNSSLIQNDSAIDEISHALKDAGINYTTWNVVDDNTIEYDGIDSSRVDEAADIAQSHGASSASSSGSYVASRRKRASSDIQCPECGASNMYGDSVCVDCGAELDVDDDEQSKESRRKWAETDESVRQPDYKTDVEAPVSQNPYTDSQVPVSEYENNGGANAPQDESSTTYLPGSAKSSAIEAMRLADMYVEAGLVQTADKYNKAGEFERLPKAIVQDRIALLSQMKTASQTRVASRSSVGGATSFPSMARGAGLTRESNTGSTAKAANVALWL